MSYWADLDSHAWDEIWMSPPSVRAAINRRVTGNPNQWPIAWLPQIAGERVPFKRAISIGCGLGHFERSLAQLGIVKHVTGIDSSAPVIEQARRSASDLPESISYLVADARSVLRDSRDLDAVFFHASLHHFQRLPEFLEVVRGALAPKGILYLDEYVGPARDEWTWRHLLAWNRIYRRLPPAVRRTRVVRRPINRQDPTEAIESSGILPAVNEHFRIVARRDYGGNLLAPIYPSMRRPDQPGGPPVAVFDAAVEMLLDREETLLRREPSFYTVAVAQRL
jgi:SAM-dependent methyltransferase